MFPTSEHFLHAFLCAKVLSNEGAAHGVFPVFHILCRDREQMLGSERRRMNTIAFTGKTNGATHI